MNAKLNLSVPTSLPPVLLVGIFTARLHRISISLSLFLPSLLILLPLRIFIPLPPRPLLFLLVHSSTSNKVGHNSMLSAHLTDGNSLALCIS
jgi:hypothetical protein